MNCKRCGKEFTQARPGRQKLFCTIQCTRKFTDEKKSKPRIPILTPEFVKKCKDLAKDYSRSQIGAMINVSPSTVSRAVIGVKEKPKPGEGCFDWGGSGGYYRCVITGFLLNKVA